MTVNIILDSSLDLSNMNILSKIKLSTINDTTYNTNISATYFIITYNNLLNIIAISSPIKLSAIFEYQI